jgi:ribose 5-phosphate isomerase A
VEVVRFGWEATRDRLRAVGAAPVLRQADGAPFVTDEGHHILDCAFGPIERPAELGRTLKLVPGVVETGLFAGMCDVLWIGDEGGGTERRERPQGSLA